MRKRISKITHFIIAIGLLAPASLLAQKSDKDKEVKEKKEVKQIIITSKGDKDQKVVIEIKGDKVTVNGKSVDDYKDGDLKVKLNKLKDVESFDRMPGGGVFYFNEDDDKGEKLLNHYSRSENTAMLGVSTKKADGGAAIQSITKESAAEKAGLKEHDIITKINDTKITEPDDLSAAIKKQKPGDKVTVTYLRDQKEQKVTAELTKWKGANIWTMGEGNNFKFDTFDMESFMPKIDRLRGLRAPSGQNWMWRDGNPKLGISVQDTDNGKGVQVVDVDEESSASKAGIKNDDIISEVDGKPINNTDDIVKVIKESKDKNSVMIKLDRSGKTMNIEVKMPKKLKTADL